MPERACFGILLYVAVVWVFVRVMGPWLARMWRGEDK